MKGLITLEKAENILFFLLLNSSRHVYQTSISRRLHFMLLAKAAGELNRD
jgi:hypothetical protein